MALVLGLLTFMASTTETTVAPKDWPKEADEEYRRIRVLGRGAFGEVWLAQRRDDTNSNNPPSTTPNNDYVAIKGVSINSDKKGRTAAREIAILKELHHPCIIRFVCDFEPASPTAEGRYFALAFVNKGKDVGDLLEKRGALPISLAQLIARHLIAAVAYLHVRGVMHRDIKPDNIMLENWSDDMMWADEEIYKESVESGRFKAILVDFGFARATRRDDYDGTEREHVIRRTSSSFFMDDYDIESDEKEKITEKHTRSKYYVPQRSTHSVNPAEELHKDTVARTSSRRRSRFLTDSRMASRFVFRTMSAVGTKHFAAPEITTTIRRGSDATKALTEFVSSYALISDAYAVGATLSELLTGVPPGQDVESYVKSNRKVPPKDIPIVESKKSGFLCCSSTADAVVASQELKPSTGTGSICLRYLNELPVPANELIVALMKESADDRLSVRNAQEHEWIGGYDGLPHGDQPSRLDDPIVFVKNEDAFVV